MEQPHPLLSEILTKAVASGADCVEMEYDSGGGLEVCFMKANTGRGFILDGDAGQQLIDGLRGLNRQARGEKVRITLDGKDYMMHVQTYDHFGENAYRLTIREAKR